MVSRVMERGCDFCLDDQNMHFGHVEEVASDTVRGLLLRCPKCGWLYLDPSDGASEPSPIDPASAATWFGYSS
jgi:hypothetical protein